MAKKSVNIVLDEDVLEKVKKYSVDDDRSKSYVINEVLKNHFKLKGGTS